MKPFSLNIKGRLISFDRPVVMGIVNVTPDSFFEDSRLTEATNFVERVEAMLEAGADIIDVGACSTRPGIEPCGEEVERQRLEAILPLLRNISRDVPVSIDTFRSSIARMAVEQYGVDIVNDISGGNEEMYATVAHLGVPYVLTYNSSRFNNSGVAEMTRCSNVKNNDCRDDAFNRDVAIADELRFFGERLGRLQLMGVADVILDPGFGFNKSQDENFALLNYLDVLTENFPNPVLVGISRKSMITSTLGISSQQALGGTVVLNTLALSKGAAMIRVHDVPEGVAAVKLVERTLNS